MNGTVIPGILALLLVASLGAASCGQSGSGTTESTTQLTSTSTTASGAGEATFTLEQLAQYDGKDGRPAYVAVDGVIYDVSGSRMWPEGAHARCDFGAAAGQDLSELIKKAPSNMRELLSKMPVVGKLAP